MRIAIALVALTAYGESVPGGDGRQGLPGEGEDEDGALALVGTFWS